MTASRKFAGVLVAALAAASAFAQAPAKPQYGGAVNIGTIFLTVPPLSFDSADWTWKFNHDMGLAYESLFAADLSKAKRNGGPYDFTIDAYLPADAVRGELAESWKMLDNPRRVEIKLRKGVMFPAKAGVMEAREFTSQDVVYSYNRYDQSAKKIPNYFDHIEKVEAPDAHTVVFTFKAFHAEWDYRFGWGYYSTIVPKEVVDAGAKDWRKANGTGPFAISNYVQGNTVTFTKNANYWDSETIGGQKYKLPFVDTINYRLIKDESTYLTALRTGRLDVLEVVLWTAVDELKKSAPQLQWNRYLAVNGPVLALRVDTKPFDDIRVRHALNMAIDRDQIMKSYYGGNAELMSYPMHPSYGPYHEPVSSMPDSIKALFKYDPEKAKKLLAEVGHAKGFSFKVQTHSGQLENDLLALIAAQLAKVGVKMEIQVMEYPAYLSAMTTKTNAPGYFVSLAATNPTTALRKTFYTGQTWNPSQYADPAFDKQIDAMLAEPDEAKRQQLLRGMTREILEKAPHIWLPTPYRYTAWWPWVKNYNGELRAGAERPGPIHSRIWIDQDQKKKLGF
jgi:peptide/nickel transport system substrate-binding protein